MTEHSYKIVNNGDAAFTIWFDDEISEALSRRIYFISQSLKEIFNGQIEESIPAYQSLTLCFNPLKTDSAKIIRQVKQLVKIPLTSCDKTARLIKIPVCYEPLFAPDFEVVMDKCRLTREQVIERHCSVPYLVHMLGFSPGFLYLGGLDKTLFCPRKATPEKRVPAGSVGIGGEQTGIYPQATPGGWQIIGRTPLKLFKADSDNPFIAEPLDRIQFYPIDANEYSQLSEKDL